MSHETQTRDEIFRASAEAKAAAHAAEEARVAAAVDGLRWLDLAARFPLRPIRTEERFEAASALMHELLDADRSAVEDDYLDVLSDLVADYEDEHHAIPAATPGDILRSLIEDKGVTQAGVAVATGIAEANLSAMLANKRGIGKATRAKLADYFGVKPARFVVE